MQETQMADDRPRRICDVCGQLDADPRHVTAVPPGTAGTVPDAAFLDSLPNGVPARAIAELMDPATVSRHMDCCAANGCTICPEVLTAAGGASGNALVKKLTSGAADALGSPTDVPTENAGKE